MKHLELPAEKCYINIERYGNTSSASIAIALDECARSGRIARGGLVGVVGFGAGLTLGACGFEY
jgi:3-oxoacyl-[acyl-carrier-protein] synthase-3